jgi:hypothetical protein
MHRRQFLSSLAAAAAWPAVSAASGRFAAPLLLDPFVGRWSWIANSASYGMIGLLMAFGFYDYFWTSLLKMLYG